MIDIADTSSGKTHRDENFPVASVLIAPRNRVPILAFYNFVRAADDISDHETLEPQQKLDLLDRLDAALMGKGPDEPVAARLREQCRERDLDPQHARDLITAFKRDVTYLRYRDWDDLMFYCRYSAMPVGRFVCDVHGEDPARVWDANDALCAALQVINHLQDCAKDYRERGRVYITAEALAAHGGAVEMLNEARAPAPFVAAIRELNEKTAGLLDQSRIFADLIDDTRLAMEVGAIQTLAERLVARLRVADPLCEKVHEGKLGFALAGAMGAAGTLIRRMSRPRRKTADATQ
ncbi:squalene synthase HpnC [Methylocystis sp. MJC1]|jgi:squalene synthase HpnC|uniref:squalene synthase HpnC n=1 Tax=Methylocystis sp. MJC1 TaxID=2654282 RepID=UPI0013EAB6D0|nr:squalene synthase HpnC [Methylocystis sp. MJC1]KAF2991276.1 15-cis-phytoene synthase [Methylocystis sp. MJC1]MBU6526185.1 squalene synthase HpnC [Methylocystis sp. MJC1]UZX12639.1 squalene synthase HpnC [Methylocystis sp. MJC1]